MSKDSHDVPARKQKELHERLKKAEEALSAIQKGEVDAVVVKGSEGEKVYTLHDTRVTNLLESITDAFVSIGRDWKYTYVNKKAEELFNRKSADMLGKVHWELFPPTLESPVAENLRRAMSKNEYVEYELFSPLVERWLHVRVYPSMEGIAVFLIDITHQKEMEAKRRELEQQKDEFIGIASHELKTPVTSVKAYTQVLKYKFEKGGDLVSAAQLAKMDAQLDKLTNLIGDLLDVTKIEAGKLQFEIARFSFDDLVREVVENMQLTTERHTLVLETQAKKSIFGDRDRIGQVLTNLISNAIKYSPRADTILITTTLLQNHVQLSVRDFGVGIAKKSQDKVFERFYRVSGSQQYTFPGLGLGLYISAEIISRLQGRMWVESAKGKGSTFYVKLPISANKKRPSKS